MSPIRNHPKIGLALGSGGAKGLAHIGVFKALNAHNIPLDYIAGSSIGSILGAHYAAYKDTQKMEDLILNFNKRKGFELFDLSVRNGLLKGDKTEKFIEEVLEGATFDSLKIPFAAVATDIFTAESVIFTKGDIVKIIRASTSVPAFYQPVSYQDRILADGGLSNPVPVDVAKAMGADITIAVNLDTVFNDKTVQTIPSLSQIPVHSINILRHSLSIHSVKTADVVITPQDIFQVGFLGWSYFFDNEKAKQIIQVGYDAAEAAIPDIREVIKEYQYKHSHRGRLHKFFRTLKKKSQSLSFTM